jgi:hypothetical protein
MKALALSVVKDAAEEINQLHSDICTCAQQSVDAAIRIGELLTERRSAAKHGEWLPWLQMNIQFSHDTARNYQRIYKRRDELRNVRNLSEAYRIALPKTKKATQSTEAKKVNILTSDEAAIVWIKLLDSVPERQRPAVARAAFTWTKNNHVMLGNIDSKYGQSQMMKIAL